MAKGREDVEVTCPKCHGSRTEWRKCPQCNGRMSIGKDKDRNDIPCTMCVGGQVEDTCGTCGGVGTVKI